MGRGGSGWGGVCWGGVGGGGRVGEWVSEWFGWVEWHSSRLSCTCFGFVGITLPPSPEIWN